MDTALPDAQPLPHQFRREFLEVAEPPRRELGDLGFFTISFVSWFIIIFGMIA